MDDQHEQPTEGTSVGNTHQAQEPPKNKGPLAILLLALVFLLIGGVVIGYFFFFNSAEDIRTPAPSNTDVPESLKADSKKVDDDTEETSDDLTEDPELNVQNFKTYTNEQLGIEFKYPEGYTAAIEQEFLEWDSMSSQLKVVVFDSSYSYQESNQLSVFSVNLLPSFDDLEKIKSDMEFEISQIKKNSINVPELKQIIVDGKNGFSYDVTFRVPDSDIEVNSSRMSISASPGVYRISYGIFSNYPGSQDEIYAVYQGIISTMKLKSAAEFEAYQKTTEISNEGTRQDECFNLVKTSSWRRSEHSCLSEHSCGIYTYLDLDWSAYNEQNDTCLQAYALIHTPGVEEYFYIADLFKEEMFWSTDPEYYSGPIPEDPNQAWLDKLESLKPETNFCTNPPIGTGIGRDVYPVDPKYGNLGFLGELFTAYSCGAERVSKIFGVSGEYYTLKPVVLLKNNPSQSLINTFKLVGFECNEDSPNLSCKNWKLPEIVQIDEIMKLEIYYENFSTSNCINCG